MCAPHNLLFFFFFNDTATTEIYTLSLHDALPIFKTISLADAAAHILGSEHAGWALSLHRLVDGIRGLVRDYFSEATAAFFTDRKSTRLNSSHSQISYAVFCLKKKKKYSHVHI